MLIKNAKIYTMDGPVVQSGWVKLENGLIAALGETGSELPHAVEVLDADGAILLPGFIDAHTHLGMWEDSCGFEGDDGNEDTDPSTPHLRAIDAVNPLDKCFAEALAAGITCVATGPGSANPIGGQIVVLKTHGRRVEDMLVRQPAAIKIALGENPKTVYHGKNAAPVTRMATAAIIREQLFKAKRYWQDVQRAADEEESPPEFDIKSEALAGLLNGQFPVHAHAHRADDIFTALRIAREFDLKLTLVHATSGHLVADGLAKEQVPVLLGPLICDRAKPELRDLTPKSAGILHRAGVKFAIISDHSVVPVQYLPLCAGLAVREGLDYLAALEAITINPARILGVDDRLGSITPGKQADLCVFAQDPLGMNGVPEAVFAGGVRVK